MALSTQQKKQIISQFASNPANTGDIGVQIALLTEEINQLSQHLQINKKDYISKRGLFIKVAKRKALLEYLRQHDLSKAREIQTKLSIR